MVLALWQSRSGPAPESVNVEIRKDSKVEGKAIVEIGPTHAPKISDELVEVQKGWVGGPRDAFGFQMSSWAAVI